MHSAEQPGPQSARAGRQPCACCWGDLAAGAHTSRARVRPPWPELPQAARSGLAGLLPARRMQSCWAQAEAPTAVPGCVRDPHASPTAHCHALLRPAEPVQGCLGDPPSPGHQPAHTQLRAGRALHPRAGGCLPRPRALRLLHQRARWAAQAVAPSATQACMQGAAGACTATIWRVWTCSTLSVLLQALTPQACNSLVAMTCMRHARAQDCAHSRSSDAAGSAEPAPQLTAADRSLTCFQAADAARPPAAGTLDSALVQLPVRCAAPLAARCRARPSHRRPACITGCEANHMSWLRHALHGGLDTGRACATSGLPVSCGMCSLALCAAMDCGRDQLRGPCMCRCAARPADQGRCCAGCRPSATRQGTSPGVATAACTCLAWTAMAARCTRRAQMQGCRAACMWAWCACWLCSLGEGQVRQAPAGCGR